MGEFWARLVAGEDDWAQWVWCTGFMNDASDYRSNVDKREKLAIDLIEKCNVLVKFAFQQGLVKIIHSNGRVDADEHVLVDVDPLDEFEVARRVRSPTVFLVGVGVCVSWSEFGGNDSSQDVFVNW